jgi:Restriction endonuclease
MIQSHVRYLQYQMKSIVHIPTLFEYYAAIHLTKERQMLFYAYRDIPDSHKMKAGFPVQDKGIDVIDATLQHIVQVKYYKKGGEIHYGKLSTFLATPILVGNKNLQLTLVRTRHSQLHREIQDIVQRGNMADVTLCSHTFLQSIQRF